MKIVIANKRYFPSSGPEIYMFNIMRMLEADGHEIVPLSIRRKKNVATKHSGYFIDHPAGDNLYFKDYKINMVQAAQIFLNAVYSFPARAALDRIIKAEKPDLLYCLSIVNEISPSIIHSAKKHKIPVVVRASDYHFLCPEARFLNHGKICKKCLTGAYYHGLKDKCVQDKILPSFTRVASLYVHKWARVYDHVGAFVTPSAVMKEHLIQGGFPAEKIHHIKSFFRLEGKEPCYENKGYILYMGRLSIDKGVDVLVKAMKGVDVKLLIAGESTDETGVVLKKLVDDNHLTNVSFVGFKESAELEELIKGAMFTIVPSIWLENSPLAVLESLSYGKPVVGSNIGGIAESIKDGVTGLLFKLGDENDLRAKIVQLLNDPAKLQEMSQNARRDVEENYSIKVHYEKVTRLFRSVIEAGKA